MPNADMGPAAYDLLIRLSRFVGCLSPLRVWNGSGPPSELQELLRNIYRFVGLEGVELVGAVDTDGSILYHKAASIVRQCPPAPDTRRLRIPVLECPGEPRRLVLIDERLFSALTAVHIRETN